jgi:hypothetical protein
MFWLHIGFNADPDPAIYLNANADPDPRLTVKKLNLSRKIVSKYTFILSKAFLKSWK